MKRILHHLFILFAFVSSAQIGPYVWQDHTSFGTCYTLCKMGNYVYASNYNGIVKVDFNEFSVERKSKINGLSDVGIKLLRTNPNMNKILVIYDNGNIDVLDENNNITNYPDFKLKTINGKKSINEVFFKGQIAYIACGFGIVVFDMNKLEVKDTYIIGPNGNNLEVYQTTLNDSLIFAATPNGLYKSNYKTKILNNYSNWQLISNLPAGPYSGVISVADKVITAYSPAKTNNTILNKDTCYILDNNVWSKYSPIAPPTRLKSLAAGMGNFFTVLSDFGPLVKDVSNGNTLNYITSYNGNYVEVRDFLFDYDDKNALSFWAADYVNGLFQTYGYYPYSPQNAINTSGMHKPLVSNIDINNGRIAISPSAPEEAGGSLFTREGINILNDNSWSYIKTQDLNNNDIIDINYVYFDRKDRTHMWASSWFAGLLEYKNNQLVAVFNASNSTMPELYPGAPRVSGLSMDKDGNLWFANSDSKQYLSVRKKDGSFQTFTFDIGRFTRRILVDKNNYVWAIHERDQGITVYRNNNYEPAVLNTSYKLLNKNVGSGNLESNSVFSICEDKDGKIWVGTTAGIRVFYTPSNIFSSSNYDAQPIKIVQDGNVELLLEKETVTAIVVDGANNKWVGTQSGGVYCFNPDGQKQLYHFTTDNSPLYSNEVINMNYDEATGDVYIGTPLGLQSYRSTIIEGADNYNNLYAYPNPVKPNYFGSVFIKGLVDNSVVKITDESGNLVWEAKSTGGQIEWPVKTLSGNRVTSGVYLVYAATTNGELKALTKVLVVN